MNKKNWKTQPRRTSLEREITKSNSFEKSRTSGKGRKEEKERDSGFKRKTVSEKKIRNVERCKTFEVGESIGSQTKMSEKNGRKLNMKMNVNRPTSLKLNLSKKRSNEQIWKN